MIIPNILNAYYSYASDYQPQGRYSLPMIVPLTYFMVMGYGNLLMYRSKRGNSKESLCGDLCGADRAGNLCVLCSDLARV